MDRKTVGGLLDPAGATVAGDFQRGQFGPTERGAEPYQQQGAVAASGVGVRQCAHSPAKLGGQQRGFLDLWDGVGTPDAAPYVPESDARSVERVACIQMS